MELIDYEALEKKSAELKAQWESHTPFRWLMFENFFKPEAAEKN